MPAAEEGVSFTFETLARASVPSQSDQNVNRLLLWLTNTQKHTNTQPGIPQFPINQPTFNANIAGATSDRQQQPPLHRLDSPGPTDIPDIILCVSKQTSSGKN